MLKMAPVTTMAGLTTRSETTESNCGLQAVKLRATVNLSSKVVDVGGLGVIVERLVTHNTLH